MATPNFNTMAAGYAGMWKSMSIKGGADDANATRVAKNVIAAEQRYRAVEAKTGVPWFWIGAIHFRESSNNFAGVLHNGEHIIGTGRKTRLVPSGRGPFSTWESAAIDALELKGLQKIKDWSIARMGYEAERFNGFGYMNKGINSPYVWAGTNHEQTGAYVADHVFDRSKDDPRIGTMAIIKRLSELRPDVAAAISAPKPPDVEPVPPKPPKEPVTIPAAGAGGAAGAAVIVATQTGLPWWAIALIVAGVAIAAYFIVRKITKG